MNPSPDRTDLVAIATHLRAGDCALRASARRHALEERRARSLEVAPSNTFGPTPRIPRGRDAAGCRAFASVHWRRRARSLWPDDNRVQRPVS